MAIRPLFRRAPEPLQEDIEIPLFLRLGQAGLVVLVQDPVVQIARRADPARDRVINLFLIHI